MIILCYHSFGQEYLQSSMRLLRQIKVTVIMRRVIITTRRSDRRHYTFYTG